MSVNNKHVGNIEWAINQVNKKIEDKITIKKHKINIWTLRHQQQNIINNNTIQYFIENSPWGFSVTVQLREVTIVSKKTKIDSKTL